MGIFWRLLAAFPLMAMPLAGAAHEFWIDPLHWQIDRGQLIEAHTKVGVDMKGSPLAYLPGRMIKLNVASPVGVYSAGGRLGDRPSVQFTTRDDGLHTIIYVTAASQLTYVEFEKFESFVRHKDLGDALVRHAKRGLPREGFVEKYGRYAKSLVSVGSGIGRDRDFGLTTEITALTNPYTDDLSGGFVVRLSYMGRPRPDAQVEVFERNPSGEVLVSTTRTDSDGTARIPVRSGHDYMLDAVVLRPVTPTSPDDPDDPVWESLWANLTFRVPQSD